MNRKIIIQFIFLIGMFISILSISCTNENKPIASEKKENLQTFTCPMHPQIIKNEMSTCPICGMDLVPFEKNSNDKVLKIDKTRQALANITTIILGENNFEGEKKLNGRLTTNPEQSNYISSRIAGRIEQLYVRETGVKVNKGQALYQLYSEQLATLQQEYLMAIAQENQFKGDKVELQLIGAAKQKLLLYGQTEKQLANLAKTQKKDPFIIFYATKSGIVAELAVTQGQYVTEGSTILRLEAYNNLWVEADVYPAEAKGIKEGQKVKVVVEGYENEPQEMTINFIAPSIIAGTQLTQVRGSIANPANKWQPGLQVNVYLPAQSKNNVLTLPINAVIRDAKGTHVWVKNSKNNFEPKLVNIGQENENQVEILNGLNKGDVVVVTGAYLLYSEYTLKKGKNPIDGLKINN